MPRSYKTTVLEDRSHKVTGIYPVVCPKHYAIGGRLAPGRVALSMDRKVGRVVDLSVDLEATGLVGGEDDKALRNDLGGVGTRAGFSTRFQRVGARHRIQIGRAHV